MNPLLLAMLWAPFLISAVYLQLAARSYASLDTLFGRAGIRRDRVWVLCLIVGLLGPVGLVFIAVVSIQNAIRAYICAPPDLPRSFAPIARLKTGREIFQTLEAMSVEERITVSKYAQSLMAHLPEDERSVLVNLIASRSVEERQRLGYETPHPTDEAAE